MEGETMNAVDPAEVKLSYDELSRFAQIARVAVARGWGRYAERLGFEHPAGDGLGQRKSDATRLREAIEELGPTFVKFGQMLSQRDDLFPEAFTEEMRGLQDRAATFSPHLSRSIIEAETGQTIAALFSRFDDEPMAAASMAQVHRAVLHGGEHVIVKVQRPDIARTVEADIAVLRRAVRVSSAVVPSLRALNLVELVEEFAVTLRGELDFVQEARNAEHFAALNRAEPLVFVPAVFWQATTRRVLTMEHSPGRRVDASGGTTQDPRELAQSLMRLFLTQVLESGVFHADPHPGNVFILPDGRLCFHDFGAVGELSPGLQENLRQLFLVVTARDAEWVASSYLGMGGATGQLDRATFVRDISVSLERYYRASEAGRHSFSAIIGEFIGLGRKHHIRLLRETTLLMRAFAEMESLVQRLDPQFSSLAAFQAYSGRLILHALLPEVGIARMARMYRLLTTVRELGGDAPIALRHLLERLERGEPLFEVRHQTGSSVERHLLRASNRLAFAMIIASIVIGSALLLSSHAGPHWQTLPVLGIVGFVVAGALGIVWAALALASRKL
jgi:ubiquinone biosynthesis protein